jgi:hypothetical protein
VDGNILSYAAEPLSKAVRETDDWSNEKWHREIVNAICNSIDGAVGYPKYASAMGIKANNDTDTANTVTIALGSRLT